MEIKGVVQNGVIVPQGGCPLPEGTKVTITLSSASEIQAKLATARRTWGDGIRRSAGCMADDPEFDAAMQDVHQVRKLQRRESPEFS
jgi:predicted DNA-binding antitoxin AbrB/MazE fold protein